MPLGRGRRVPPMPMPAAAGVLEHRSRPRNTTRPDALTRGLSAATAGRGRAGARGCNGAREFLPESDEDADEEEETRVRSGCCRFGGAAAAPFLPSLGCLGEMRWRRLATGAERVRRGDRDGGGGRRAFLLPESQEEADEDEEESRERSGRRPRDASVRHLLSPAALGFLVTRRRRSRRRRPAQRGARGESGSGGGSVSWQGGGEQGAEGSGGGGRRGTSFPPEKSSSAAESAAAAAGMRNSKSPSWASSGDGAVEAWNEKGSFAVMAATAVIAGGCGGALTS